ncbi:MAG: hypothetical protein L3J35_03450 [Bacteroidales bacterium]|nr:hypothetical protein [Bacteroidales bacterium]
MAKAIYFTFIFIMIVYGIFLVTKANLDFEKLLFGMTYIWLGIWVLVALSKTIKIIEIFNETITIKEPLFGKKIVADLSNVKYNDFEFHGKVTVSKGILLKLEDGRIIEIYNKEYLNSSEIINYIIKSCERKPYIKSKKWTKESRIFIIGIVLIFLSIILLELFK